jgi:hypothetical protein
MVELVPKIISNVATELVEATNLNSIEQARRSGRAVIIKRRNVLGDGLARLANAYFEKAGLHIRFLVDASDWQRREIGSYNLLNGDTFKARPLGDRGIVEDKLPGRSIWDRTSLSRCVSHMMSAGQPYSGGGGDIRTRIANGRGDADSFHTRARVCARKGLRSRGKSVLRTAASCQRIIGNLLAGMPSLPTARKVRRLITFY